MSQNAIPRGPNGMSAVAGGRVVTLTKGDSRVTFQQNVSSTSTDVESSFLKFAAENTQQYRLIHGQIFRMELKTTAHLDPEVYLIFGVKAPGQRAAVPFAEAPYAPWRSIAFDDQLKSDQNAALALSFNKTDADFVRIPAGGELHIKLVAATVSSSAVQITLANSRVEFELYQFNA